MLNKSIEADYKLASALQRLPLIIFNKAKSGFVGVTSDA
jgi:hypothetical protein